MRLSRWTLLWLLVVGALVAIAALQFAGVLTSGNLVGYFILLVYGLVLVAVLAIVGGFFVGLFMSHRILSTKGFTPFEQEMLRMRQEVRDLSERIDEIASRVGLEGRTKPKGP